MNTQARVSGDAPTHVWYVFRIRFISRQRTEKQSRNQHGMGKTSNVQGALTPRTGTFSSTKPVL